MAQDLIILFMLFLIITTIAIFFFFIASRSSFIKNKGLQQKTKKHPSADELKMLIKPNILNTIQTLLDIGFLLDQITIKSLDSSDVFDTPHGVLQLYSAGEPPKNIWKNNHCFKLNKSFWPTDREIAKTWGKKLYWVNFSEVSDLWNKSDTKYDEKILYNYIYNQINIETPSSVSSSETQIAKNYEDLFNQLEIKMQKKLANRIQKCSNSVIETLTDYLDEWESFDYSMENIQIVLFDYHYDFIREDYDGYDEDELEELEKNFKSDPKSIFDETMTVEEDVEKMINKYRYEIPNTIKEQIKKIEKWQKLLIGNFT